jgi:hypothetical protein
VVELISYENKIGTVMAGKDQKILLFCYQLKYNITKIYVFFHSFVAKTTSSIIALIHSN